MKKNAARVQKKCVVAEGITFDDYKTYLFDGKTIYKEQVLFEYKKYEIYTVNKHEIFLYLSKCATASGNISCF